MYEYKCANCGKKFELIQKFSDAPLTVHEECGSGPVERLISVSALQFKGSGWYVNDYGKNGGGKEKSTSESKKSESSSDSKSSESSSGDAKSPAKTESPKPAAPAPSSTSQ